MRLENYRKLDLEKLDNLDQQKALEPQPVFVLTSLDLAAYLLACGFELQGYSRLSDGRMSFRFPDGARNQISDYYAGEYVSAIKYWDGLKRLKSIIHNG